MICYVVAAGLTYGEGEGIFHSTFKEAWHGRTPHLEVFGKGDNILPTLHIQDLARYTTIVYTHAHTCTHTHTHTI